MKSTNYVIHGNSNLFQVSSFRFKVSSFPSHRSAAGLGSSFASHRSAYGLGSSFASHRSAYGLGSGFASHRSPLRVSGQVLLRTVRPMASGQVSGLTRWRARKSSCLGPSGQFFKLR
ncbi:MAG: hypothetical protein CFE24_07545 [Flavobacterium sp. BFFFF2]|nr:MAG: hypothetical protein CFE24_07545 [Flavobacterium sp. BFFFF2]